MTLARRLVSSGRMADALRHAACELLRDDKVPHGLHECLSKLPNGQEFFLPFFHPAASACLIAQLSTGAHAAIPKLAGVFT